MHVDNSVAISGKKNEKNKNKKQLSDGAIRFMIDVLTITREQIVDICRHIFGEMGDSAQQTGQSWV